MFLPLGHSRNRYAIDHYSGILVAIKYHVHFRIRTYDERRGYI